MSAVDTNVLVRFHVRDDEEQYQKVKELFSRASSKNPIFINFIVLIEWAWVLSNYYKVEDQKIAALISTMLESSDFELEDESIVANSLSLFEKSNVGFADCLISEVNKHHDRNPTFTFDKKASKLKGMKLLE
ncbi:PIN domain-containing protein [Gracilimonas sp.]|uniref:PIN domain-containing protein n=1 Tax=Gracilimonas sp. TaxID=1974203 RepID=UPI00287174A4|nr:type II toxin-antitoxin system VapC family toxin [Gracilimonas sp.]